MEEMGFESMACIYWIILKDKSYKYNSDKIIIYVLKHTYYFYMFPDNSQHLEVKHDGMVLRIFSHPFTSIFHYCLNHP